MAVPQEKCLSSYEYIFNPELLREKVAFITGGGSGIGFRVAEILMRHGCRTVIASRNYDRLKLSAETLSAATGQKCLPIQMDVRKPNDVLNAVDKALSYFKRIDILINNAAGNFLAPVVGLSFNAYKTVIDIDTVGTFNVSKVIYEKYMQKNGGVIVNITATLHYRGQVLQAHAGSAKAAIDALTKHFAVEWGPDNVRVVGIAPGLVAETGFGRVFGNPGSDALREYSSNVPLQRESARVDVAHTVLFSVSPAASMITGHTIVADGGAWMTFPNSTHQLPSSRGPHFKSKI